MIIPSPPSGYLPSGCATTHGESVVPGISTPEPMRAAIRERRVDGSPRYKVGIPEPRTYGGSRPRATKARPERDHASPREQDPERGIAPTKQGGSGFHISLLSSSSPVEPLYRPRPAGKGPRGLPRRGNAGGRKGVGRPRSLTAVVEWFSFRESRTFAAWKTCLFPCRREERKKLTAWLGRICPSDRRGNAEGRGGWAPCGPAIMKTVSPDGRGGRTERRCGRSIQPHP